VKKCALPPSCDPADAPAAAAAAAEEEEEERRGGLDQQQRFICLHSLAADSLYCVCSPQIVTSKRGANKAACLLQAVWGECVTVTVTVVNGPEISLL